jgi:RHS repeat-associated protein
VADIVSLQDYYAFGMEMPERTYNADAYRYGFNGKENDKETGWQDYGFRMYDPRICRFPSVDPLTAKYPFYTPYQFAGNMPIQFIDLDGLEPAKLFIDNSPNYPVIGFISAATGIAPGIIYLSNWQREKGTYMHYIHPDSPITVNNNVYFNEGWSNKPSGLDDNTWLHKWIGLIGHESTHIRQYHKGGGFLPFVCNYFPNYLGNLMKGQSDYTAYRNIEKETEAYENESLIESFFQDKNNATAFDNIYNNSSLTEVEKYKQFQILAIEKIVIPKLEKNLKGLKEANADKMGAEFKNACIKLQENEIEDTKKQLKSLKNE